MTGPDESEIDGCSSDSPASPDYWPDWDPEPGGGLTLMDEDLEDDE